MLNHRTTSRRGVRMNSESSSSDSDLSDFSVDVPHGATPARSRRRGSISSVSTNPEEEVYVMVLQNKIGLYENLRSMTSLRDLFDVTFLIGEEKVPVHGVRALISARSRKFQEIITCHQEKLVADKNSKSTFRKAVSKVGKFACSSSRRGNSNLTISIPKFDPQSFQRLITYIHTGILTVDSSTVVGLLNAGYKFELQEVLQACWTFALGCMVRDDNMRDLFESANRYKDHKMTTMLMNAIWSAKDEYPSILSHASSLANLTCTLRGDEIDDVRGSLDDTVDDDGESLENTVEYIGDSLDSTNEASRTAICPAGP